MLSEGIGLSTCPAPDGCHTGPGTCENGSCKYTAVVCNSPPTPCHASVGACTSGACNYAPLTGAACPGGQCENGICVAAPPEPNPREAGPPDQRGREPRRGHVGEMQRHRLGGMGSMDQTTPNAAGADGRTNLDASARGHRPDENLGESPGHRPNEHSIEIRRAPTKPRWWVRAAGIDRGGAPKTAWLLVGLGSWSPDDDRAEGRLTERLIVDRSDSRSHGVDGECVLDAGARSLTHFRACSSSSKTRARRSASAATS